MESRSPYIGKRFGNYRIIAEIDGGSFGHTLLARHAFLDNRAVVKLLHASRLHSSTEYKSFLQEARILKMLEHPHVLPIYEFGVEDGLPYQIAQFAERGSLRDHLQLRSSRPLLIRDAVSILTQIGQALHYAHGHAIVHRDVKPANILFNSAGKALLADFGIATVLTQTEQVSSHGTPAYMAPEQFEGLVSPRSDQYILGCVAYELVTGQHPFTIATPGLEAMWLQHTRVTPVPPSKLNAHVPPHIERAILKAMAKRYESRHTDIETFIRKLYAYPIPGMRLDVIHQTSLRSTTQELKERYVSAANALYYLKHYEEALVVYEQAILLAPNLVTAYSGKGDALFCLRRYMEALAAYKQAASLAPDDAAIQSKMGNVLYYLRNFEEALAAYERALRSNPFSIEAREGKNILLTYIL